jgi:hypothetical protein
LTVLVTFCQFLSSLYKDLREIRGFVHNSRQDPRPARNKVLKTCQVLSSLVNSCQVLTSLVKFCRFLSSLDKTCVIFEDLYTIIQGARGTPKPRGACEIPPWTHPTYATGYKPTNIQSYKPKPHNPKTLQHYKTYKPTTIQPYKTTNIQPYKPTTLQPYTLQTCCPT